MGGKARQELHKHYEEIRSLLPRVCHVEPQDMNSVQEFIWISLDTSTEQSDAADPCPHGAKAKALEEQRCLQHIQKRAQYNHADGSAWVSPKWQHQNLPRLFAEPIERRRGPQPELVVSIPRY